MNAIEPVARRRTSMHAVAQAAGVATSTVSRYVKGELNLVGETEEKVLEAMARLGYDRQSWRRRQSDLPTPTGTGLIGLLVPEVGSTYYARFAGEVIASAELLGYNVVITSVGVNAHQASHYVELLTERGLQGAISINIPRHRSVVGLLAQKGVPIVAVDEGPLPPDACAYAVEADNYSGSRQVITYLTRLGHERIAVITGPRELRSVSERYRGYLDGLRASGLDPREQFDLEGEASEDFGFAALSQLLAHPGKRPTAAYVAADEIAIGVLAAAAHLRLRVPHDLSVVGFDDITDARRVTPSLTTVRIPLDKMAETAVNRIVEAVEGQSGKMMTDSSVLPVTLIVRASAGAPVND